jgi:hypothetical protein
MNMSEQTARLVEERENRGNMVQERRGKEVKDVETAISIVYVMYMRFVRRSEVCSRPLNVDLGEALIERESKRLELFSEKLEDAFISHGTFSKLPQ